MVLGPVHFLASLLALLLSCHGRGGAVHGGAARVEPSRDMPELDVTTPLATITNPTVTSGGAAAKPVAGGGGGGSWCVASQSASATALQVALDYACGQGGADCSAIQPGGSCANPDTIRDHASFAFNSYYQKNPVQTSCDFAGAAVLTTTDPSSSTCQYPSTSTGASVLNTSTPTTPTFGSPTYGFSPPGSPGFGNSPPLYGSMSPPEYGDNINAAAAAAKPSSLLLLMACLVVATMASLNLYK